jgi:hypothetical protein
MTREPRLFLRLASEARITRLSPVWGLLVFGRPTGRLKHLNTQYLNT